MKKIVLLFLICCASLILACGGSSQTVKLGESPLTIFVQANSDDFSGFADIYINSKLIGTTDSRSKQLKINLKKGEYKITVTAEGYQPWHGEILLLGQGYRQSVLAQLLKL